MGPGAFEGAVGELAREQASLPTFLGGVGIRSTCRTAPAAFLGAWALAGDLVKERFLHSGEAFLAAAVSDGVISWGLPFQVALRAARDTLPEAARLTLASFSELGRTSERGVQERLAGVINMRASEELRGRLDPVGQARLLSEMGPGAAA